MEGMKKSGFFGLYHPKNTVILPFNSRPSYRFFKRCFKGFASVEYGCNRARGPRKLITGTIIDPRAASHCRSVNEALATIGLRGLEFQDARQLLQSQDSFPVLDISGCERIWFCGTCVFQRTYLSREGSSCVSYYPALVRRPRASGAGYIQWGLVWEYAFDESEDWRVFDVRTDRLALARL